MKSFAIVLLVLFGCGGDDDDSPPDAGADPGALVRVSMESTVGVVLDEIPEELRDRAADGYIAEDETFWRERAIAQILHTTYRLVYRNFYYDDKQMLALPPREVWDIQLEAPVRQTYQGHDAVVAEYRFESTLLSDLDSPEAADPALAEAGGAWPEPFNFPLDPELLFQRTGYACMDEADYPLRSVDSENAWQLFDQDCVVESPEESSCHLTEFPEEDCLAALEAHVGRVDTELRFERLEWDAGLADAVRVRDYASSGGPDLEVIGDGLLNHRVVWRYFEPNSCALDEECVGGPGWRRLLEFDASIVNASPEPLTVGEANPASPFLEHNNFIFSECHQHYHYSHYGAFAYGDTPGDKRAFCIESTDRYFNSEETPLVHPFGCHNQGVASGWGDTYIAGIECNWIDITDLDIPDRGMRAELSFRLNPDDFICEGAPVVDGDGKQLFEETKLTGENDLPVDRPRCTFVADHAANNFETREIDLPATGGFITSACTRRQAGPLRDCGWEEAAENFACTPGQAVTLSCSTDPKTAPQAVRICERSVERGHTIACMFREALGWAIVGSEPTAVTFTCPEARSPSEPGGSYGWFVAGLLPDDLPQTVTCEVVP